MRELRPPVVASYPNAAPVSGVSLPSVAPRRVLQRTAGVAQGTEGLAYVHRLKGGPGMKPLTLEPCIHCRAVAVLPRMRKDCRVLTKRLRRWPMREPAEVTRNLAQIRHSVLRLLALAETYAQGPCVKTTHR